MRDAWTDERLDDLNKRVDEGFREVREEIRTSETNARFDAMNARFDAMQRTLLQVGGGLAGVLIVSCVTLLVAKL
jgi:hypothetical protein